MNEFSVPVWTRIVLTAAGIYNLLWGVWVVLLPATVFELAGLAPVNYPEIWQCVGMLVGVYGIGYLVAASHPLRHWPIVFVGLLGKVLGPMGMVWAIIKGTFPLHMAWVCVTNDLIWWPPFAIILWRAYSASSDQIVLVKCCT